MMTWFRRKKGQNVAEYAILIALVVGAIIAMQKFAQRGLQSRIRGATDYMVDHTGFNAQSTKYKTAQYEPYYLNSDYDTTKSDKERKSGGAAGEKFSLDSDSLRTGSSNTLLQPSQAIGDGMTFD